MAGIFGILLAAPSGACIHNSKEGGARLDRTLLKAFSAHDGKNAHLVVQFEAEARKFPKEIAWVIPVPALPKVLEIEGPFFQKLFALSESFQNDLVLGATKGFGDRGSQKGVKVHETIQTANYVITPLEILEDGDLSAQVLNQWLQKNNFKKMPLQKQKPYLKKGAVFLAIQMTMMHSSLGSFTSKPLHLSFSAKEVGFPIRFFNDQRVFDFQYFVFSQKSLKSSEVGTYLKKVGEAELQKGFQPFVDEVVQNRSGKVTLYSAKELNAKGKKLDSLNEDILISQDLL